MQSFEGSDSFGHHVCFAGSILNVRNVMIINEGFEEESGLRMVEVLAFLQISLYGSPDLFPLARLEHFGFDRRRRV